MKFKTIENAKQMAEMSAALTGKPHKFFQAGGVWYVEVCDENPSKDCGMFDWIDRFGEHLEKAVHAGRIINRKAMA